MLEINKDQLRSPIGGHHYPVIDGPLLRAEKFVDLVEKLADHRTRNGLPAGDPEQEILSYYEANWPFMVRSSERDSSPESPLFHKWCRWVRNVWKNPPRTIVTTKEAELRWEVCEKCPRNRKRDWSKTPESEELSRRTYLLTRGSKTSEKLGICDLHCWDLSVATYLVKPIEFSAKNKNDKQENNCWV